MKKNYLLVLLSFLLVSCEEFTTRKISSEEILVEETRDFNWHEVDQYPAFDECREIMEENAAKACFENKVAEYFFARLAEKQPVVTRELNDTLYLFLRISEKGNPGIDSMQIDSTTVDQLPKIRTWIRESVDSLPKIYPATKRGIPVVTTFKMPIVIQAE